MGTLLSALISTLRTAFLSSASLALENVALRQQLTIHQRNQNHPMLQTGVRAFWILLRRFWSGWERALIVVKPETLITWASAGLQAILA